MDTNQHEWRQGELAAVESVMPAWHTAVLREREQEFLENPSSAISWETAKLRLKDFAAKELKERKG